HFMYQCSFNSLFRLLVTNCSSLLNNEYTCSGFFCWFTLFCVSNGLNICLGVDGVMGDSFGITVVVETLDSEPACLFNCSFNASNSLIRSVVIRVKIFMVSLHRD